MTPTWTQYRRPDAAPAPAVAPGSGGDRDGGHLPRVWDGMTVEVALAVMAGARVEYLTVCDEDDERTGSITRGRLAVLRDGAGYTDRVRLRDVLDGSLSPHA